MAAERFLKSSRLRRRREFLRVQESGQKASAGMLLAIALARPERSGEPRLGITVSKKVGNAVARVKIRRRLRELYRRGPALPKGVDVVLVARRGADEVDFNVLRHSFAALSERLKVMFP